MGKAHPQQQTRIHRRQPEADASWEVLLVKRVVRSFRTRERDELEAELFARLLELKSRVPSNIQNWERYVARFLFNKATNVVRNWRAWEQRIVPAFEDLESSAGGALLIKEKEALGYEDTERRRIILETWSELGPKFRNLWLLLVEANGNRQLVSKRLGRHRNTVRLWIDYIRERLTERGLSL